jgi:hypothetical protein
MGEKVKVTRAELREAAIQMILAEVGQGYRIEEAVARAIVKAAAARGETEG